jgi:hypothetical protein
MRSALEPGSQPPSSAAADRSGDDVGAFLAAVATIMRETVVRLEATVGHITESVLTRARAVDPDLIVTLQNFDRLQQEFTALGDVVAHVAATAGRPASDDGWVEHHGRQAVGAIPIADLRNRFLHHLGEERAQSAEASRSDEVLF